MPADERPDGGLELRPFRALRYDPARVGDVARVTCPPYDVIRPGGIDHWRAAHPANVVRLVLPQRNRNTKGYDAAARLLSDWRDDGTLRRAGRPALHVYEQIVAGESYVGLLGAVSLHDAADRVVLPHEDVFPGPVADRLELMDATDAQLEPIMLVVEGSGVLAAISASVAAAGPPWLDLTAEDDVRHRLWVVEDTAPLEAAAVEARARQALIADGHHRYAGYLALRSRRRAEGRGAGPWDFGLAWLVDAAEHPLALGPVHRLVERITLDEVVHAAAAGFDVSAPEPVGAGSDIAPGGADFAVIVTDGRLAVRLARPSAELVGRLTPGHSRRWAALDAAVVQELLLAHLLGRNADDQSVRYVHNAGSAVARAAAESAVAVLLRPPALTDVHALAAAGEKMPRKSTSFGPKPLNGLVIRPLDSQHTAPGSVTPGPRG